MKTKKQAPSDKVISHFYKKRFSQPYFLGQNLFYGVLGIPSLLEHLQKYRFGLRHFEYDQHPEKHLYVIAQKT